MEKILVDAPALEAVEEVKVHPLKKSYMIVSKKHVDYDALTAFEAVSMSLVLVMAVMVGVISSTNII